MIDRQTGLDLARLLNEVVVSADRIGSSFHDDPAAAHRELAAYLDRIDFVRRASKGRGALFEALWPDAPPADDEAIEAELSPRYWRKP